MILVYGGVQVDVAGSTRTRFPARAVEDVGLRVRRLVAHLKPRLVLGAAASGADLVVARAALLERVKLRLVLPHDRATFRATSVESAGAVWTAKYDRLLADLEASDVEEGDAEPDAERVYEGHNRLMIRRAVELAGPDEAVWCLVLRPAPAGDRPSVSDDLAEAAQSGGLLVLDIDPAIGRSSRRSAFVAMPYGRKFDPDTRRTVDCDVVFDKVYVPVLEDLDLEWQRADLEADSGIIHVGMIDSLARSDLVIADMFSGNANVAYELGLRHALAPRATLLTRPRLSGVRKAQTVPFDLRPNRYVGFVRGQEGLSDQEATAAVIEVRRVLQGALTGGEVDSPVHDWFGRDAEGTLRRRLDVAKAVEEEATMRSRVRAAIQSSSTENLLTASQAVESSSLGVRARRGVQLQLAVALANEEEFAAAEDLFKRSAPDFGDPLRLRWLQQYALVLSWSGGATAEGGGDPSELWSAAEKLLSEAISEFGDSEESCGIAAGVAKRQFNHAVYKGDGLRATAALRRAAVLYGDGFRAEPNYYAGVNLIAALRLDAQHFDGEARNLATIRSLLPVAHFFASREVQSDPHAFWPAVSLAELALHAALLEDGPDVASATNLYAAAAAIPAPRAWRKSAADQLKLFARCGDDQTIIDQVLCALERDRGHG